MPCWVPLRQAAPGCSAALEAAVEKALRVEVGERHKSCDAFDGALLREVTRSLERRSRRLASRCLG